jgi:hypothetical protein
MYYMARLIASRSASSAYWRTCGDVVVSKSLIAILVRCRWSRACFSHAITRNSSAVRHAAGLTRGASAVYRAQAAVRGVGSSASRAAVACNEDDGIIDDALELPASTRVPDRWLFGWEGSPRGAWLVTAPSASSSFSSSSLERSAQSGQNPVNHKHTMLWAHRRGFSGVCVSCDARSCVCSSAGPP